MKAYCSIPVTWLSLPWERKILDKIQQGVLSSTVLTQTKKKKKKKAVLKETSPFLQKLKQVQTSFFFFFLDKQNKDNFHLGEVLAWHQIERIWYSAISCLARLEARDSEVQEEHILCLTYGRHWNISTLPFFPGLHSSIYENIHSQKKAILTWQCATEVYKIHCRIRRYLLSITFI